MLLAHLLALITVQQREKARGREREYVCVRVCMYQVKQEQVSCTSHWPVLDTIHLADVRESGEALPWMSADPCVSAAH